MLHGGRSLRRAARPVAGDFGAHIGSRKRIKLLHAVLLRGNVTGVQHVGHLNAAHETECESGERDSQDGRRFHICVDESC